MDSSQLKWIADFIWNIADDRLRDVYVRGKYRDVILPFTVLRRLDAVLEATKTAVLAHKQFLDENGIHAQDGALRVVAGQAFYNTSPFTLTKLKSSASGQRLRDDFVAYLNGLESMKSNSLAGNWSAERVDLSAPPTMLSASSPSPLSSRSALQMA